MSGQLTLMLVDESLTPAAVWETLPPAARAKMTIMLARLLAAAIDMPETDLGSELAEPDPGVRTGINCWMSAR